MPIFNTTISGGGAPAPSSDRQIAYNLSGGVLTTGNTTPAEHQTRRLATQSIQMQPARLRSQQ